jgi:tRNA(Arg) A34 adenosine deaminase TadA
MDEADLRHLRRAIEVARRAREHGNQPFGAVLVDADGQVVLEAENTVVTDRDFTGHAEANLMRLAARRLDPEVLPGCTVYTSTEPCAMCAGAIYWGRVGRVVYGLDVLTLDTIVRDDPGNPTPLLRAEQVLGAGKHRVLVEGPALVEEARAVHDGFWGRPA